MVNPNDKGNFSVDSHVQCPFLHYSPRICPTSLPHTMPCTSFVSCLLCGLFSISTDTVCTTLCFVQYLNKHCLYYFVLYSVSQSQYMYFAPKGIPSIAYLDAGREILNPGGAGGGPDNLLMGTDMGEQDVRYLWGYVLEMQYPPIYYDFINYFIKCCVILLRFLVF